MKLCVAGILVLCLNIACRDTLRADRFEYEERSSHTIDLSGQTRLVLENTNGTVDIAGSDTTDRIHLDITKRVSSFSAADARDHIDDIEITYETEPTDAHVEVDHPVSTDREYTVDFTIVLPVHFDFAVTSGNGAIGLSSTVGDLVMALGNGDIGVDDVESRLISGALGNGHVDADVTLLDTCSVSLDVGNGGILLRIPRGTNARVEASVGNGEINYSALDFQNLEVSDRHLEGVLGDGSGAIVLSVGNGDIELLGR